MNKPELTYISGFWLDRKIVKEIDRFAGNEMSRTDAIRTILALYFRLKKIEPLPEKKRGRPRKSI